MFANDALLLIGHGSTRYPDAGDIQRRHAEALRAAGVFRQVESALLNGEPSVAASLARIACSTVHVVPFFMEDGYFTRVAVPRALGGDRRCRLRPPVGLHEGLAALIEQQGLRACAAMRLPPETVTLLAVGHGSARAPGRALALYEHAVRTARLRRFARVEAACLEEPPLLADTLAGLRDQPVVVLGYFAGGGAHVRDDVPDAISAERAARGAGGAPVHFAGSVTSDPGMLRIILDQVEGE